MVAICSTTQKLNAYNYTRKSMRIGILTLPFDANYGGVLQAWALQIILKRMGHDVEVFNLRSKNYHSWYMMPFVWFYRTAKKMVGLLNSSIFWEYKYAKEERHKYGLIYHFYNNMINSRAINSLDELANVDYDTIMVGSDQVWREEYIRYLWHSAKAENAFLYQTLHSSVKKVAYAASLGIDYWSFDKATTMRIKRALESYSGISVREKSAVELLRNNTGVECIHVCDPTMLLSAEEYRKLLGIKKRINSGIVSYILDSSDMSEALLSKVADSSNRSICELNKSDDSGRFPSVEHWVETIANAEMVITDSFHGCIFSIIFRKPLIFMVNNRRGSARFSSLVETFGLSDHKIAVANEFNIRKSYALPCDIDERINNLKSKSLEFLRQNLEK